MSKVLTKISLIEQVKNLLKEEIANGYLKPGQRIESIRSLLKNIRFRTLQRQPRLNN